MRPAAGPGTLMLVMLFAAEPAHQTPPAAAITIGSVLVLTMLLAFALAARASFKVRRGLRTCAHCGARAVRRLEWERMSPGLTRVTLECGQCSVWRRILVEDVERRTVTRRIERDCRRLARCVRRVEAGRKLAECRAFIALLQSEIVGVEDFLAQTRPPAPPRRRSRHPSPDEERKSP
jgi:hypothetical protein